MPFNECECDEKEIISSNITGNNGENAILFKTTSESEQKLQHQLNNAGNFIWIIYNIQTEQATLYVIAEQTSIQIFRICNFPDFAKNWNVSDKGQKVYIEGVTYKSCQQTGGPATTVYFDCVLTTLVKKWL